MKVDELNLRNPICIGYYDPFNIYSLIQKDLESKFPLTNLHWKYHATKPVKSIPLLPVKLVEEVPKNPNRSSQAHPTPASAADSSSSPNFPVALTAYKTPNIYSRLMFVKFETIETYRAQVRPLIKEWLKNLVLPSNSEWMIILFVPATSKDKQSTIIKTSTFDKLKHDFGVEGKELKSLGLDGWWINEFTDAERCFKLKETKESNLDRLESYNELISLIKSLLLTTFDNKYQEFSDKLVGPSPKNLDTFIVKLRYADLFNDMRILQDSLNVYNELYKDLDRLWSVQKEKFSMAIPDDIINYSQHYDASTYGPSFESPALINHIKSVLLSENTINLFGMKCLIFINQSILLQFLANFANTISISAIYISNLYQKLIFFLNDLSNTFVESDLGEFIFSLIDTYLDLPICHRLIETNNSNNEKTDTPYQLNEILEFQGELKLFKRSKLMKIARSCGYTLSGFNCILDEVSLDSNEHQNGNPRVSIKYAPLMDSLKSEEAYFSTFEKLTEDIIQQFASCNRSKTIDILSIDLALLSYQKGKLQESLNILQDSYDFFILNGWNFMGGVLLEIYLDCIEKLKSEDHKLILTTCLKLFSSLIYNKKSQVGIDINNFRSIKTKEQVLELYSKIQKHSSHLSEKLEFPMNEVFSYAISPFIKNDENDKSDHYDIEIELKNLFGIEFEFEKIELDLAEVKANDSQSHNILYIPNSEVKFSTSNVKMDASKTHKIKLKSSKFVLGNFVPMKITIYLNRIVTFSQSFDRFNGDWGVQDGGDVTVIQYENGHDHNEVDTSNLMVPYYPPDPSRPTSGSVIPFYPDLSNFHIKVEPALSLKLGTTDLVLTIYNGQQDIKNVVIEQTSSSKGLKIKNEKVIIDSIKALASHEILVPYTHLSENKLVNIRTKIDYSCENGQRYTHIVNEEVDTTLRISVSVQDIFKTNYIYSKFQIGTSSPKSPIRLLSTELTTSNTNYEIIQPRLPLKSGLVAFGEQPASIFYKIVPKSGYRIGPNDNLDLKIEYTNLKCECYNHFEKIVKSRLKEHSLLNYWFLLDSTVLQLLEFDLNNYAINSFIRVVNAVEIKSVCEKVVRNYVELRKDQITLMKIFTEMLQDQKIEPNAAVEKTSNQLFITVPVSSLKYLQVVRFDYEKKVKYLVGEPIEFKLNIETITKWFIEEEAEAEAEAESEECKEVKAKESKEVSEGGLVHFQLTLHSDDNWLISGFKKHTFSVDEHQNTSELNLILIPLNVGKLLLPKVLVKCLASDTGKNFFMDTDVVNGLETVLVVPDLESIAFSF